MKQTITMQSFNRSQLDRSKLASFEKEIISSPTKPLIHMDARFLFIQSGNGTLQIGGKTFILSAGALVILLPWQISEITSVKETLQYDLIPFHFDTISACMKLFVNEDGAPIPLEKLIENKSVAYFTETALKRIQQFIFSLREELGVESLMENTQAKDFSSIRIINLLTLMLTEFLRSDDSMIKPASIDYREILRYMYLHCNEKITLQELADKFYCSKSTISNHIASLTGLSFFDLLNEMRIGKTANYLLYTDLTLKELAEILGYVDDSHISKVFAARLGTKISEYRETYQKIETICRIDETRLGYSIVNFIYRNYPSSLTVKDVAKQFGISVTQLNQILIYQVDKNFEDFLNMVRVNRACELLKTSELTVLDIALEVGYHTSKTLTRSFLKIRQMTPGAFKKMVTDHQME